MKMTQLGLFLRQLRMENDELLLDMARKLDTTPSKVSSVEMGKATMPIKWRDIIIKEYGLDREQIRVFDSLIKDENANKPVYVLMQERYDIDTLEILYTKPILISTDKQKILNYVEQHKNDKGIGLYIENTFMI